MSLQPEVLGRNLLSRMLAHGRRRPHIISIGVTRSVETGNVLHAVSVFFDLTRSSHMSLQRLRTGLCLMEHFR